MNEDKPSRADVKIQRQAKKLAKSSKKTKSDGGSGHLGPNDAVVALTRLTQVSPVSDKALTSKDRHDDQKGVVLVDRGAEQRDKLAATAKMPTEGEKLPKDTSDGQRSDVSGKIYVKSKAELRAERRAKQEAQRAAKEAVKSDGAPGETNTEVVKLVNQTVTVAKPQLKPSLKVTSTTKAMPFQPKLLSHLQIDAKLLPSHVYQTAHPAIVELGAKYEGRVVSGSNARCLALMQTLKKVIVDFVTPAEKEFSRAMETKLNDSMAYLSSCRPSSVSMTNALKHVKSHLTQLTTEKISDDEAQRKLCDVIDTFIKEQIDVAGEAICNAVANKIANGDTITIYGCSSLLHRILVQSHNEGKQFEVVVVDGGPLFEGREMCHRLIKENIQCSYVLLPGFSYVVRQTTKVLLGAHALLANGCVMSRSGSAVIALVAKAHNVPVIVCCETYKFCERVQADAFVHNELGPQSTNQPPTISLMYDMTPPTLVDAVATELAILPCTSVPVVLRVKPSDISYYY